MLIRYLLLGTALLSLVACTPREPSATTATAAPPTVEPEPSPTATATADGPASSPSTPAATAESTTTITATALDVSLSARIIMLTEPVGGFDVIAVTEETRLVSSNGEEIRLQAFRPGATIRASGRPGLARTLLASEVQLLDTGTATPTAPPPSTADQEEAFAATGAALADYDPGRKADGVVEALSQDCAIRLSASHGPGTLQNALDERLAEWIDEVEVESTNSRKRASRLSKPRSASQGSRRELRMLSALPKESQMARDVVETPFRYVAHVNRQDVDKLAEMMTEDHRFVDPSGDEAVDQDTMRQGWVDYFHLCPDYMIHVSAFHQRGNRVFLMGQTTGSHLDLPWREEFQDKMIWIADVAGDQISLWKILADTEENRRAHAIPA